MECICDRNMEIKCLDSSVKIVIDDEYSMKIKSFAINLAKAKVDELHHKEDNNQELKRFTTGLLGEAALEKLFGIHIIDWSIGDSKRYNSPDIPGYKVGIKTVECGKYPVISKKNDYPQIICIKCKNEENTIFVCGLASKEILNSCQNDDLILDSKLRQRGKKTCFNGFEYIKPVHSLDDIAIYKI